MAAPSSPEASAARSRITRTRFRCSTSKRRDRARTYTLLDAHGRPYRSPTPGTLGGHRRQRLYGRLDCPGALRAIARGGYVANRVFFADEATAIAAGYRPCWVCLREQYHRWKADPEGFARAVSFGNTTIEGTEGSGR